MTHESYVSELKRAVDPIVAKPTLNPGLHLGIHFFPALTWSQGIFSSSIETKRPFWIFEPEQKYSKQEIGRNIYVGQSREDN